MANHILTAQDLPENILSVALGRREYFHLLISQLILLNDIAHLNGPLRGYRRRSDYYDQKAQIVYGAINRQFCDQTRPNLSTWLRTQFHTAPTSSINVFYRDRACTELVLWDLGSFLRTAWLASYPDLATEAKGYLDQVNLLTTDLGNLYIDI